MASKSISAIPKTIASPISGTALPPPKDYNVPPPVTTADLAPKPPVITNSLLPNPRILTKTATKPASQQISLTVAKPGEPEPYCVGHCMAEAKIVAADDTGERLVLDLLWSRGEIDEFIGFWLEGSFEGLGDALGKIQHFRGTSSQIVSSIMDALKDDSYDALLNRAHSVVSWRNQATLAARMEAYWLKLYDPRLSPADFAYSTNPALFLARMLVDCGYTLDWASVAEAANYCDEPLGSPAIKRWEIGGQILNREDLRSWIHTIQQYCSCFVDTQGATVKIVPDKPRSSNHTVTHNDMLAGSVSVTRAGGNKVPASVTVIGQAFDGSRVSISYGTPAGPGTHTTLQMPFFQDAARCGRKAEEVYRKAHNGLTLEFVGFDESIRRTIGDVGTVTNAAYGISAELMTLIDIKQISPGRWWRKYEKYDATNYSDVLYGETGNGTTLDNPYNPPEGPTPSATEETFTSYADGWLETDGATYQRFVVTFTGVTWAYIRDYYITFETDGEIVYSTSVDHIEKSGSPLTDQTHTITTSFPLIPGAGYTIKVYCRSIVGALSDQPGIVNITALVDFYSFESFDAPGDTTEWTGTALTGYTATWEYDVGNDSDHLRPLYSLADAAVPDTATIVWVRLDIKASKSSNDSVVNLKDIQMIASNSSPSATGNVKTGVAVTTTPTVYTWEGDMDYWGLSSAEAMQMFDDSGDGFIKIVGECVDTLAIPSPGELVLTLHWIRCSVQYEE